MKHPPILETLVQRYGATHAMAARKMADGEQPEFYDCVAAFPSGTAISTIFEAEKFLGGKGIRTHFDHIHVRGVIKPVILWLMPIQTAKEVGCGQ